MDVIFLVYGLSFLAMGIVIVVRYEDESRLDLAGMLWLLASFGFVHGFREWMDLWRVVRGDSAGLATARPLVLLISYLPLFEFGRRLTQASLPDGTVRRLLGVGLYGPVLGGILAGTAFSDQPAVAMDIWSRYLLGFPGAFLAGIGFLRADHARSLPSLAARDFRQVRLATQTAGIAFLAYALFGGVVVPPVTWGPGAIINQDSFLAVIHVPVQAFRAACAVLAAVSVATLLKVFHLEAMLRLRIEASERLRAENEQRTGAIRLTLVLETVAEGIIGIDPNGQVMFANRAATELLGWPSAEALAGMPVPDVLGHHLHDGRPCTDTSESCRIRSTLADGKTRRVADETFIGNRTMAMSVEYVTAPLIIAGNVVGAVIAFHDITERQRNERALATSKAELEQFAEILTHHLQEPVRLQHAFAQLLRKLLPTPLPHKQEQALDYIMNGASRLHALLRDVQLFLSLNTPPVTQTCAADAALDMALIRLESKILNADASIERMPLPHVCADCTRLAEVFTAVLDNAITYHRSDHAPRIRIAAERLGAETVLSVTDNGIGIPAEFHDRVFKMFERLHPGSNRPGTGIGLALARKIVESARGHIWVESPKGGGTRVCILLPAIAENSL
ncbi:MAG: PAS domain S-box protein [Alphaproteobacteria bacterium]|nr:PAS domain S-box protein [Alphaproteobacteria bacterium]